MAGLTSDKANKPGVNGKLTFEPLISTFDKLRSIPLKIAMSTVAELLPDLTWAKNWSQHTIYVPTDPGETSKYLVWCAMDHLHGKRNVFFNEEEFDKRMFRECFQKHEYTLLAQKGWGKGKGKTVNMANSLSKAEVLDPNGSFMEQIGLTAKGSSKSGSRLYTNVLERTTKAELPFRMYIRPLASTEFIKTYNDHLYHFLTRWA
eukprot:s999_g23.t1